MTTHGSEEDQVPHVIVHLVHGTWAHGFLASEAPWLDRVLLRIERWREQRRKRVWAESYLVPNTVWFYQPSTFTAQLRKRFGGEITIVAFEWSGRNSFRARRMASARLRRHLLREFRHRGHACHLIVAHSHGGNVALDAIRKGSLLGLMKIKVAGLVTLATPFISHRVGRWYPGGGESPEDFWEHFKWGWMRRGALALALGTSAVAGMDALCSSGDSSLVWRPGSTIVWGAWLWWAIIRLQRDRLPKDSTHAASSMRWSPVPILVTRGHADEASLSLGLGQTLQRISALLTAAFIRLTGDATRVGGPNWGRIALSGLVLLGLGVWLGGRAEAAGCPLEPNLKGGALVVLACVAASRIMERWPSILDALFLIPTALLGILTFGWDALPYIASGDLDVESLPATGNVTSRLIDPQDHLVSSWHRFMGEFRSPSLRHGIYDLPETGTVVAEWIDVQRRAWWQRNRAMIEDVNVSEATVNDPT